MNERIKELESQCWEARPYGPPWFDSKKFAQLIIDECIAAHVDNYGLTSSVTRSTHISELNNEQSMV